MCLLTCISGPIYKLTHGKALYFLHTVQLCLHVWKRTWNPWLHPHTPPAARHDAPTCCCLHRCFRNTGQLYAAPRGRLREVWKAHEPTWPMQERERPRLDPLSCVCSASNLTAQVPSGPRGEGKTYEVSCRPDEVNPRDSRHRPSL